MPDVRLTAFVHGRVQGVGFRWWTRSQALELGISGSATNLDDGRVCVVAEGTRAQCEELLTRLSEHPSRHNRAGRVTTVVEQWGSPRGVKGFTER
ncbi:acylphosphatase [Corynebacterium pacaense]|uniref:acylphosphatase n=1 Tax=Corynebacterium pacaense TaxID=1816684 RepID=UPI0009BBAC32|nr:acylphosphatase [Corynebacterium pacaense]